MEKFGEKQTYIFLNINKRLWTLIFVLIATFFVAQIFITSQVGTKSAEIDAIRTERDELRLENEILSSQIDEAKSIENIKKASEKFGLSEITVQILDNLAATSDLALGQ